MKIFIPILTLILLLNFQGDAHCGGCASDAKADKAHSHGESHTHETSATSEASTVEATASTTAVESAKSYQDLNLTEKQQAKYGKLISDYEEKFQKLEKDFVKKIKKILTDEQYKSFVENNKELKTSTDS